MKKKHVIIIIIAVVLIAVAIVGGILIAQIQQKPFKNEVADSLPKYESATIHSNEGDNDLIKYGKYVYKNIDTSVLDANEYLRALDLSNIAVLLSSIEQFESTLESVGESNSSYVNTLKENYDFESGNVRASNYFYVKTVTNGEADQLPMPNSSDELTVYYFDVDAQILYYFYVNLKEIE